MLFHICMCAYRYSVCKYNVLILTCFLSDIFLRKCAWSLEIELIGHTCMNCVVSIYLSMAKLYIIEMFKNVSCDNLII